jgi:dolichol-phosphate mannosyltransferase
MSKINQTRSTAVIIIPTYNEAENIGKMIDYLNTKTFPPLAQKWDLKILVVDGNSPDGTGKVVSYKSKKWKNTYLYTETSKDGIGAAYLKGFKYAIDKLKADYVFEFDGDFQHPPETIPLMLQALDEGYDYVVGSRKIKGGSNPKGWGFKRVFFSEVGGFAARFIMFFPFKNFFKVTDPTTGLKATRVKGFIDQMDLDWTGDRLLSRSFGYKLQLLYETLKMGAKYKEIPLEFHVRNAGESKIEAKTAKDILLVAIKLRWRDELTQKFIKFAIVGGIGFVVNIVGGRIFKNLLTPLILSVSLINGVANGLAAELSIISNFIWNNLWTFSEEKITGSGKIISKFLTFNASSAITGIAIPSVVISLLTYLFGDHFFTYQVIAIFCLTIPLNWIVYNKVIWKKNK